MKKVFIIGMLLTLSISGFAQVDFKFKGVGAGLTIGSGAAGESDASAGLFINGLAQIMDKVDAEASLAFYVPGTYYQIITLNANGHYNFFQQNQFTAYGLAGLNLSYVRVDVPGVNYGYGIYSSDYSSSHSYLGLNIGAGGAYELTPKFDIIGQVGYTISEADQLFINAGVMYKF